MDQQQLSNINTTQAQPDLSLSNSQDQNALNLKKQLKKEKMLQKLKNSSQLYFFIPETQQTPQNIFPTQENSENLNDVTNQPKKTRRPKKKNKQIGENNEGEEQDQTEANKSNQQNQNKQEHVTDEQQAKDESLKILDQQQTDSKNRKQDNQNLKEDSQQNQHVTNKSNKKKVSNQNHIQTPVQQQKNLQKNIQNDTQSSIISSNDKNNIKEQDERDQSKEPKAGKKNIVILQSEKQKQKKQGYYSKINYNLSEIIEKQIIPIKLQEKQTKDQHQTDEKLIDSIQVHVLGKNPKKLKNKQTTNKLLQTTTIKENSNQKDQEQKQSNGKIQQNLKDKQSDRLNELDEQIQSTQEEIKILKEQQLQNSGWSTEILSEKELKQLEQKMKQFQKKLDDLILKKDMIFLQEKQLKEQIIQQQQERKKQRYLRKLKRLGFLKNIAKEIAMFKIKKGIPHPRQNRVIKYKAVPDGQLDFELIEKKKKKVSKIKTSLKTFQEQENLKINQDSLKIYGECKDKVIENDEDHFETVAEDEKSDQENTEINDKKAIKNQLKQKKDETKKFKEDHLFETPTPQETQIVYKLPAHIDENNNLEGFKYNNMQLRSWVDHMPNQEIDNLVLNLVNELAYKQAMKKINDPKKFKKRIVAGFKEVLSTLTTNVKEKNSKCIIFALNLQKNPLENGSDQLVLQIINLAIQKKVPIIHSCSRARLGKAFTGKFGPRISVLSVLNYENLVEQVNQLEELVNNQRMAYFQTYKKNENQGLEQNI